MNNRLQHTTNNVVRIIETIGTRISSLTIRRKFMILSLILIFLSYMSAPLGVFLLMISLIIDLIKCDKQMGLSWKVLKHNTFMLPGFVLVASAVIGPVYYGNYSSAGLGILVLAPIVICASLIEILWTKEDVLHFARYATMLLIPVCIYAFFNPWSGSFLIVSQTPLRLMGTFSNPNYFSYVLEIILLFTLALLYHVWKRSSRNCLIFSGVMGMLCLYLTDSRSGMLSLLIGLTVFYLCMSEKSALMIIFGLISLILIATAIFPELSVSMFKDIIPRSSNFLSEFNNRFALWEIGLNEIYREPFLGTGINTYRLFIPVDAPYPIIHAIHAHNIYINFLLELGLPGLISFGWIVFKSLKKLLEALKNSELRPYISGGIGMISVTLVHGSMDAPLVSSQSIALFGLLLGALSVISFNQKS